MRIYKFVLAVVLAASVTMMGMSCDKPDRDIPEWPWNEPAPREEDDPEDPVTPDEPDEPDTPEDGPQFVGKPRYVWIDASANFRFYANDKDRIASDIEKIKSVGFTDIIVDVRPTEGSVLFNSSVSPHTARLAAWVDGKYKYVERTADFDYLQAFIEAGHKAGLRVNAAMNTFVCGYGGYYGLESEGPIFSGDIPAGWASVVNTEDGLASSYYDGVQGTVFMNPANPDVREYMLDLIGELASYDLDGIILDRCRYDDTGLQSDFSQESRTAFEQYVGKSVENWPSDIFKPGTSDLPRSLTSLQKSWMSFRVKTIHDFVESASNVVHQKNPEMRFGCYVGAWYNSYYSSGVNWASPDFNARSSYSWADADYSKYGYADHCDFMMLGCYAGTGSVYGNGEWTMQGFAKLAKQKIGSGTEVAGGPDVGNSTGFESGGQSAVIPKTVDACINACDGYFVFDLCHIRMYDYWDAFRQGFNDYLETID